MILDNMLILILNEKIETVGTVRNQTMLAWLSLQNENDRFLNMEFFCSHHMKIKGFISKAK